MIIFITNKKHNVLDVPDSLVTLSGTEGLEHIRSYVNNNSISELAIDTENTDLDAYRAKPLLLSLGNPDVQFVIDMVSVDARELLEQLNKEVLWLGHNLKYDYSVLRVQIGLKLDRIYDTLIAEQKLYAGYFDPKDKPFQLDHVIQRNLGFIPHAMIKIIRNEFVGANPTTFIFENRHVMYSAGDVPYLFPLRAKQELAIDKYKLRFSLYEIEFPLIKILGETEIEGFDLDVDALRKIVEENKKEKFKKETELDNEVRLLRDGYNSGEESNKFITAGKFDRERKEKKEIVPNLLFDLSTVDKVDKTVKKKPKPKPSTANINWNSPTELINIIGRLGFPVPTKKGTYIVPIFNIAGDVVNKHEEFTTGEAAIEQYLIDNPDSPIKLLLKTLIEYREVSGELSKYGLDFIKKINPSSGKIHTQFRQASAVNGRFQSGGGREDQSDKINIQNVPRKKKFRQLFFSKGYTIVTCDLTGAEAVILADKANDEVLYNLSKGDIHSYCAMNGWRRIHAYRAEQAFYQATELVAKNKDKEKLPILKQVYEENLKLAKELIVSKALNNESHRQPCKNLTYAGFYGVHEVRAAKTINVSRAEGAIYIQFLRETFPRTFHLVDSNASQAFARGYLVFHPRTNSRIWFPEVVNYLKTGVDMSFKERHEVDSQARNTPISGTQADMIKEAIVEVDKEIRDQKIDANLLMQVHDELVYRCPKNMDGISDEFRANPKLARFFPDRKEITRTTEKGDTIVYNNYIEATEGILMPFPQYAKLSVSKYANRYLNNFEMEADVMVANTWTK